MCVDIQIYLKRLKDFFETDEEARRDMFGNSKIDMELFYKMVRDKATINVKNNGDPMLSGDEMLEIITELAFKDIEKEINIEEHTKKQKEIDSVFVKFKDGFPPFCLN